MDSTGGGNNSRVMTPKQAAANTAAVLLVIGTAWLLLQIREVLIILILAITFAAAIAPVVRWLRGRGLSQGQSVVVIYGAVIASIAIIGYLAIPSFIDQGTKFADDVPSILTDLEEQARNSNNQFLESSGTRALRRIRLQYAQLRSDPSPVGETAVRYADSVLSGVFGAFTMFVVTYYWITQRALVKRISLARVPLARRERAFRIWDEIEERLGGWVRGQLLLSAIIGGVSMAGYWLLGLDYWLTLGIIAGVTEVIPFLGPIIGGGAAVLVALTDSPEKAILTLLFVFVLQQLEGAVLVPRVMENAVGLNPLSVILAVLVGGTILGPLGAILAIPLAAALQVLVSHLWEERDDRPDTPQGGGPEDAAPRSRHPPDGDTRETIDADSKEGADRDVLDLRTL